MSPYDADDIYCIPGCAVLKNKAGITDQDLLDEYEGDFTAIRLLELTQNPIEGSFDLDQQVGAIFVEDQCDPSVPRRKRSSTTAFHFAVS